MKKVLVIFLATCLSIGSLLAQDEPETLFGSKLSLSNFGIMVAPGFQLTQLAGAGAGFAQFRAGVVLHDKLTLGGFYGELINDARPTSFANLLPARAHLDSYQAGGFIEYTLHSSKLVHLTLPLSMGLLEMEIDEEGRDFDYEETKTFFVEPGAQLEVNLHRFARLHAGVGYRIMGEKFENSPGVPDAGNSLTFNVGLKMGLFQIKK
jgi:hypothetical protein